MGLLVKLDTYLDRIVNATQKFLARPGEPKGKSINLWDAGK